MLTFLAEKSGRIQPRTSTLQGKERTLQMTEISRASNFLEFRDSVKIPKGYVPQIYYAAVTNTHHITLNRKIVCPRNVPGTRTSRKSRNIETAKIKSLTVLVVPPRKTARLRSAHPLREIVL